MGTGAQGSNLLFGSAAQILRCCVSALISRDSSLFGHKCIHIKAAALLVSSSLVSQAEVKCDASGVFKAKSCVFNN